MSKWPAYRAYRVWLGGRKTSPELWEWLMGTPSGWSGSKPLATDKFLSWRHGLGSFLEDVLVRALDEERENEAVFDWAMGG
jgi:hypothetical protein